MTVDGFRFLSSATRRVMRAWRDRDAPPAAIPWTPLRKPLAEARVALISSAGLARSGDKPFDQQGERDNPWWGDPTYRTIPSDTVPADVFVGHMHVDPRPASEDLDCIFPLRRLNELVAQGVVGSAAPDHYSIMGYVLKTEQLLTDAAPEIADGLGRGEVDLALLAPV